MQQQLQTQQENLNLDDLARDLAIKALNRTSTVREAAVLMGISERTLFNIMDDYEIKKAYVLPINKIKTAYAR